MLARLIRLGDLVEPDEVIEDIVHDPADTRVLEGAAAGGANVIVSGDRRSSGSVRGEIAASSGAIMAAVADE